MKDSARYVKRVEWSDEDRCFVGSCPGVIGPCCHGDDEVAVYRELCGIVDEWLEVMRDEDGTLPERTDGRQTARPTRAVMWCGQDSGAGRPCRRRQSRLSEGALP